MQDISDIVVLAVEDQSQSRKVLQLCLKELGISQIYTANDGAEALDFMGTCGDLINMIICDWNMPKMSGLELLRQIRSADPDLPFIMVTGRADHDSVMDAKLDGVSAYVAKPFSVSDLKKKISHFTTQMIADT